MPPELWLKIFRMATFLPGLLTDPAPPYRIEASPHQPPTDEDDIKENEALKCSLVLVCRSWQQMATELLYEIITVRQRNNGRRSTRAKALRWALAESDKDAIRSTSKHEGPDDGRAYLGQRSTQTGHGRWVKQLTFDMHHVSVQDVSAILAHCPNLRCLIVDKKNIWRDDKIEEFLLPVLPSGLIHVELMRTGYWGNTEQAQNFSGLLRTPSSIKALVVNCATIDVPSLTRSPSQISSLTLHVPNELELRSLKHWLLPALTHLTLIDLDETPELLSAIRVLGPQLLFVDIRAFNEFGTDSFRPTHFTILGLCPHLLAIVLNHSDVLDDPDDLSSQSLTHIVIMATAGWLPLQPVMETIISAQLPSLVCVRILAGRDPGIPLMNSPEKSRLWPWILKFHSRGIAVEDEDGLDLLSPYRPVKIPRYGRKYYPVDNDGYLHWPYSTE